jgi:hypothetical protein
VARLELLDLGQRPRMVAPTAEGEKLHSGRRILVSPSVCEHLAKALHQRIRRRWRIADLVADRLNVLRLQPSNRLRAMLPAESVEYQPADMARPRVAGDNEKMCGRLSRRSTFSSRSYLRRLSVPSP